MGQYSFLSYSCQFFVQFLRGKGASGLERILCGVLVNPLPDMPILGSSNSMANECHFKKMNKWGELSELKTLWKKEKLLVTSNFSFSHNVFKSCLFLMRQNEYLWSKGLKELQESMDMCTGHHDI